MPEVEILYDVKNRSGTVGNSAYVRFINKTEKVVEIVWLNHTGKYIRYRILKKDYFVDVNTYNAHLWVAFDHETKDRLHIDKEFVYHPKRAKNFSSKSTQIGSYQNIMKQESEHLLHYLFTV